MSERISKKPALSKHLKPVAVAGALAGTLLAAGCSNSGSRGGEVSHEQIVATHDLAVSKSGSLAMQHFGVTGNYTLDGWERPYTSHVIVDCEPTTIPGVFNNDHSISIFAYTDTLLGDRLLDSNGLEDTVSNETCETYMPELDTKAIALRAVHGDLTSLNREIAGDGQIVTDPQEKARQLLDQTTAGLCYDGKVCQGY